MLIDIGNIFTTIVFSIISALIVVPIVFIINKKMEFDSYLHLLNEEIKWNMDKIEKLPDNLNDVREKKLKGLPDSHLWLPAKATNQPEFGYVLQYLSLNVYNNLKNQPFWNYISDGSAGRICTIFYWFSIYNQIIHKLQCDIHHSTGKFENYNEYFFSQGRFQNYVLLGVISNIREDYSHLESTFDDISIYKKELWWCPKSIKNMLDDD